MHSTEKDTNANNTIHATRVRPLTEADLVEVVRLQKRCYAPEFHEPIGAFRSKLNGSPQSCWVIASDVGEILAYLVAVPVDESNVPSLHLEQWIAPQHPTRLYVHDVAVSPLLRGTGAPSQLLSRAQAFARQHGLADLCLIAVQDSVPYWRRHGFAETRPTSAVLAQKLASFGASAQFMTCATAN